VVQELNDEGFRRVLVKGGQCRRDSISLVTLSTRLQPDTATAPRAVLCRMEYKKVDNHGNNARYIYV
jgi:hypothetical protein